MRATTKPRVDVFGTHSDDVFGRLGEDASAFVVGLDGEALRILAERGNGDAEEGLRLAVLEALRK